MIEIAIDLPLPRFDLRLSATLGDGVTAVMGPSGSGKTSLLEALAGLRRGTRGRIVAGDRVLLDSARGVSLPPERRRLGYVPQDAGLFPHLDALGNVRFGARADGRRVESAIDTLEIRPLLERRPHTLSGGEKQRVALARALATDPLLLLLDEPLAALDRGLKDRILPYLARIRDEWKVPSVYVTHNAGEALALAGHVLLLRDGAVEAQGHPLDLLAAPGFRGEGGDLENLLEAKVLGHDESGGVTRLELAGGLSLRIPLLTAREPGSTLLVAIRAEDVLVSLEPVRGLSARNAWPAEVLSVERTGPDVTLRCRLEGQARPWIVRITPAAAGELGLAAGGAIWLAVKSHSVRAG